MKLINMIIYRTWEKELDEIREIIEAEIQKEKDSLREIIEHCGTAEEFFSIKDKLKKLTDFSWKIDGASILDFDLYAYDNPLYMSKIIKKIEEIIESGLD